MKQFTLLFVSLIVALLWFLFPQQAVSLSPQDPTTTDAFIYEEAQTVYLGNLARQANGVPPLRWNNQLSQAARWFAWDSVENRPEPYCGHQDTNGQWPGDRARIFGYLGFAGAENAFCGWVTPQQAIDGWMNSPGHRANLLDPNSREAGLGFYRRTSDGRGYVAQGFGTDAVFPPVVIENEALNVNSTSVNLYIYDRTSGGGFAGLGPATQMMVSNNRCFDGASWEPYSAQKAWTLTTGMGWRTVYVKTEDSLGRTSTVSDTIYLGSNLPVSELSLEQASSRQDTVTIYDLDGGGLNQMQFSQNWAADDTFVTFGLNWGNGVRVNDTAALGGTAFRLYPGNGESNAWVWTTEFIKSTPMVAYVRLKVNNNSSTSEVARFGISGGGVEYGPLSLRGIDFAAANQYQEFLLPFTYHDDPNNVFLIFNFWRSGSTDVYVDAVRIFTAPVPVTSPFTWEVPGDNYRGQGIGVRYTNGTQFSAISEAHLYPDGLVATPSSLLFLGDPTGQASPPQAIHVWNGGCVPVNWQANETAPWLFTQQNGDSLEVWVDAAGMAIGSYTANVTITAPGVPDVVIPITLQVVAEVHTTYMPMVRRTP